MVGRRILRAEEAPTMRTPVNRVNQIPGKQIVVRSVPQTWGDTLVNGIRGLEERKHTDSNPQPLVVASKSHDNAPLTLKLIVAVARESVC